MISIQIRYRVRIIFYLKNVVYTLTITSSHNHNNVRFVRFSYMFPFIAKFHKILLISIQIHTVLRPSSVLNAAQNRVEFITLVSTFYLLFFIWTNTKNQRDFYNHPTLLIVQKNWKIREIDCTSDIFGATLICSCICLIPASISWVQLPIFDTYFFRVKLQYKGNFQKGKRLNSCPLMRFTKIFVAA